MLRDVNLRGVLGLLFFLFLCLMIKGVQVDDVSFSPADDVFKVPVGI
jgi:hypothetical protein